MEFMRLKINVLLNHQLAFFLVIACLFSNAFAQEKNDAMSAGGSYRYIVGLDIGISATTTLGNTTSFPLGYSTFNYSANNTMDVPLRFGTSFRRSFQLSPQHALQLGMSYHYTTNMDVDGSLQQGISPPFYPFTYHYSIDSSQVLAEAKLLQQWRDVFYPYLMGGIGAGFNRAKNYSTSVPDYLTFTPYYVDKSTTSFSYTVGLGIDFLKFQFLSLGLGYRFSDLGRAELGNGSIRNRQIAGQLKQSHLYLNTALLEVNYFF